MLFKLMTAKQEAALLASSFTAILFLGIASLIALCIAAMWCLALVALTCLESIAVIFQAIGSTFQAGEPLTRLVILLVIGLVIYRAGKPLLRRIAQ